VCRICLPCMEYRLYVGIGMFNYSSEEVRTVYNSEKGAESMTQRVHIKNGKGHKEVIVTGPGGKHRSKQTLNSAEVGSIQRKKFIPGLFLSNIYQINSKKNKSFRKGSKRRHRTRKQKGGQLIPLPEDSGLSAAPTSPINLQVKFGTGMASQTITDLSLNQVQAVPTVSWMKPSVPVTFICWDADSMSQEPGAVYLHWVVSGLSGVSAEGGKTVLEWEPPAPPAGTGTHRYFFGLFSGDSSQLTGLQRVGFQLAKKIPSLTLMDWVAIKVQSLPPASNQPI